MSWKDKYIRLEKLEPTDNPDFPTPSQEEYENDRRGTIPSGYWVTGNLINEPEVGSWILIARDCRNGVEVTGLMHTSIVQKIDENDNRLIITTLNSVYVITEQQKEIESQYLN